MTTSDIIHYLGTPWKAGIKQIGVGFDCWTLLVDIYDKYKGIKLPLYPQVSREWVIKFKNAIEDGISEPDSKWKQLDKPKHLDVVAMSKSIHFIHHVGVYLDIDGGMVIHAVRGSTVACEPLTKIKQQFVNIKFYEYDN